MKNIFKKRGEKKNEFKEVLYAALSTVTAVSLLASCGGKGKMQMDKSGAYRPESL